MERFELDESLQEEIRARVHGADFMKLVQTVRRGGATFRISLRPVEIGGARQFQAERTEGRDLQVKNLDEQGLEEGLSEIIAQKGAREMHVICGAGDLHIRVTKKGHALVSRSGQLDRAVKLQPHDRVKAVPLTAFDSGALLRTLELADAEGRIRASMRGKYDQVNEFLKVVETTLGDFRPAEGQTFTAVDCGCGKAYLTLALYFYLREVKHFPSVRVIGIDRRADVIAMARKKAAALDVTDNVMFMESDLETVDLAQGASHPAPVTVDMVISLHACDTATDEAMARGVEWKARYVLSAPCCQHELQAHMSHERNEAFAGLLRQSILRERLCDILTDSFRAMLMRIAGYRTQVIEFVSSEATMRNILIKCEYLGRGGQSGPIAEYLALRDYWHVKPWLETRLAAKLGKYFAPYC